MIYCAITDINNIEIKSKYLILAYLADQERDLQRSRMPRPMSTHVRVIRIRTSFAEFIVSLAWPVNIRVSSGYDQRAE